MPAAIRHTTARLLSALDPAIPRHSRVALIGFPNYDNVGDSAIWCATRKWLYERGTRVVYQADEFSYNAEAFRQLVADDAIVLFQGGGNFGDLYPWHQELRIRVMRNHVDHRYVQLPQTIEFRDPAAAAATATAAARVRSFRMFCREPRSREFAQTLLGVDATLCPDMAFAFGDRLRIPRPRAVPGKPPTILWLARSDNEALSGRVIPDDPSVHVTDWTELNGTFASPAVADETIRTLVRRATRVLSTSGQASRITQPLLSEVYRRLSTRTVANGLRLLASADIVVTDRLHGHILSSLVGIPHVILETGFGKVRACHEQFTAELHTVRFADDAESALAAAREPWPGS